MSTQEVPGQKKTRTRQHVIADLATNYVERFILLRGFSADRIQHDYGDYGIDLVMFTYNEKGEVENGQVLLQVKATDHLKWLMDARTASYSLDREDLKYWLRETDPVLLVVYDGKHDRAYWLYVQAYFEAKRPLDLLTAPGKVSVRIPRRNRVSRRAIGRFATFRDNVEKQIEGRIRHYG